MQESVLRDIYITVILGSVFMRVSNRKITEGGFENFRRNLFKSSK